jgi:hypothetical protein
MSPDCVLEAIWGGQLLLASLPLPRESGRREREKGLVLVRKADRKGR